MTLSQDPMIGYALLVRNPELGVEWFGLPHEILAECDQSAFDFSQVSDHEMTEILARKVRKDGPDLEFHGGEHAQAILDVLEAVLSGDSRRVERVLDQNPDLPSIARDSAGIPVLAALVAEDEAMVQLLVSRHFGLNAEGALGMTALHWAGALGRPTIAKILVDGGADSNHLSWLCASPAEVALWNEEDETAAIISGVRRGKPSARRLAPADVIKRMEKPDRK